MLQGFMPRSLLFLSQGYVASFYFFYFILFLFLFYFITMVEMVASVES